jgi:DNA ligase (NAD+)
MVVHCEAVISKSDFAALNAQRAMDKLPGIDSPRTWPCRGPALLLRLRRRDRGVGFLAWGWPDARSESHLGNLADLRGFGLSMVVARHSIGDGRKVLADILRSKAAWAENILCPTDGVVAKLDSLAQRRALGTTAVAPRWAEALKF